jgi:tRNA threonylcarbamoyladenosine biosynthesis protein TsaE
MRKWEQYSVLDEEAMRHLGATLASRLNPGAVVLLDGELGVGKTTLVRGLVSELGITEPVRSPTFNLVQVFSTTPPVLHADLYRVKSCDGLGIEDYLDTHVCLVEWPDRAEGLIPEDEAWLVKISFEGEGRHVAISPPRFPSQKA